MHFTVGFVQSIVGKMTDGFGVILIRKVKSRPNSAIGIRIDLAFKPTLITHIVIIDKVNLCSLERVYDHYFQSALS